MASSRSRVADLAPSLPPLPGVAHDTRYARAAASVSSTESDDDSTDSDDDDSSTRSSRRPSAAVAPPGSPHIAKLLTKATSSRAAGDSAREAGARLLRQHDVWTALRIAMHVKGDTDRQPEKVYRVELASRYLHSRITVDRYTAHGVLLHAFSHNEVIVVRGFPGATRPAYASVTAALGNGVPLESRAYDYDNRGCEVHYILKTAPDDSSTTRNALAWWAPFNLLHDRPIMDDLHARTIWSFISRRAGSLLHLDQADGTTTQWHGRKLWAFVDGAEAAARGIVTVQADAMRERHPGTRSFSAWLACPSFRWTIMDEGDTVVLPRNVLHGVRCVGDHDSVAAGVYCRLAGTPPLSVDQHKAKKRKRAVTPSPPPHPPPPSPLSIAARAAEAASSSQHSPIQRVIAATLIEIGQPASLAAAQAGLSPSTATRWSKRLASTGVADDAPRSGRPRATDALADAAIARAAELNPFASSKAIRAQLVLPVSEDTINRRLDAAGLPSHIAAQKRHYTDEQRRKRLSFAEGFRNWTAEQWETVIFSDEKTFEGRGRHRQQRVHRPDGHRFDPAYTKHSHIYSPSRHVFACFCSRGPGFCVAYEGRLDGPMLRDMLDQTLIETAADYYDLEHGELWWFQHDNAPQFKSRVVQEWLHNHGVHVLDFPPLSPDLNPIENLWPRVQTIIDQMHPATDEAVADAFIAAWPQVALDLFTNLAQSMPERIAAVIEAGGDATKF